MRYEVSHEAMGTIYTIVAYGRDKSSLADACALAFEEIDTLDDEMSNYKAASELSRVNREAAQSPVTASQELFNLIQYSQRASEASGGDFDITVGPLMQLWGFFRGQGRLPGQSEIAEVQRRIGYRHVHLDAGTRAIHFDVSGMSLDLGGIAKGYAVDRAAEILRAHGVYSALISSGGSSVYALGSPPGERGWKITVRDPYRRDQPADVLRLRNFALLDLWQLREVLCINGGKVYCHIMDPHTGWPVQNMLSAVAAVPTGAGDGKAQQDKLLPVAQEKSRQFVTIHPNILGILYQPGDQPESLKRTVIRSTCWPNPLPTTLLKSTHPV